MSIGNFISKLKDVSESNLVSVHVPSLNKVVKFKQINVKQQKDLIKTGLDGSLSVLTFSNAVSNIILENLTDKVELLVTDKLPILLALRKASFGSTFKYKDDEKEYSFDLEEILKTNLVYSDAYGDQFTVADSDLVLGVKVPTLLEDKKINDIQLAELRKLKKDDVSETIVTMYLYELIKFIFGVKFGEDSLDLRNEDIKNRIKLVESLPTTVNNDILAYISRFRTTETAYITKNGVQMPIDVRLFSNE